MGAQTTGSPNRIQPNTYNSFQQAVMRAQEQAGQSTQGMLGREQYMNSAPMNQEMATMGQERAGMLGSVGDPNAMGSNIQNAAIENTAANNAGMLGNVETMFNMEAEARNIDEREGIDFGPGRGRRIDRRTEAMEQRGRR